LTEAENWDLLADCTSQDGGEILDAGVHLSDKRTLSMGFTNITQDLCTDPFVSFRSFVIVSTLPCK
jgi:hypothetical protein